MFIFRSSDLNKFNKNQGFLLIDLNFFSYSLLLLHTKSYWRQRYRTDNTFLFLFVSLKLQVVVKSTLILKKFSYKRESMYIKTQFVQLFYVLFVF